MKIIIFGPTAGAPYIAKLLARYDNVERVYVYDPHPVIPQHGKYFPIFPTNSGDANGFAEILETINTIDVDLVLTVSLQFQLWEDFRKAIEARGIPHLIPTAAVGMLEWSKIVSKKLLHSLNIPTPLYKVYTREEIQQQYFDIPRPFVLKYDKDWRAGLQTVIVTDENYQTEWENLIKYGFKRFLNLMGDFTDQKFVVEEFIKGSREYSYHVLCNGKGWTYLGSARDYKKCFNNDVGNNTTGMGSYSPVPDVDPIIKTYVDKILNFLKFRNMEYFGFLYLGIMVDDKGIPQVLEINTRPGDPEIVTILSVIKNNLADLFYNAATNKKLPEVEFTNDHAVSIRVVHKEFDLDTKNNPNLPDLWPVYDNIDISYNRDIGIMHSLVTAIDNTREAASNRLYKFLDKKHMGDFRFRTDIGYLK